MLLLLLLLLLLSPGRRQEMCVPDQNGFTQRKDRARIFPGRKNGEIDITICIGNILYTYGKAEFECAQLAEVISQVRRAGCGVRQKITPSIGELRAKTGLAGMLQEPD